MEPQTHQLFAELKDVLVQREDGVNKANLLHAIALVEILVLVDNLDRIALSIVQPV